MVTRGIEICFLSFLWAETVKRAYCKNFLIPRNPRRIPGGFSTSRQRRLERQIRRHLWLDRILVAGFSPSLAEKAVPAARDAVWVVGTHYHSCTGTQDRGKGGTTSTSTGICNRFHCIKNIDGKSAVSEAKQHENQHTSHFPRCGLRRVPLGYT